jgi:nucleoporin NUP82
LTQTIKTTVSDDIRQLIISPNGSFLAILTSHTIHIALLPDSSHLTSPDTTPMRLKTYTLGPTTHVTSQSALASALWHPLGVYGSCLVTVTEDAVVRLWEVSPTDRWSFDRPTLAIDLRKLADGTSLDQNFGASVSGMNKAFSPDSVEMEVASACFGGRGSGGWSPMTLWVAMRQGDVYALCPLLPEKWSPPPMLIPSLSVSIVAKVAAMEDDPEVSEKDRLLSQQQLAWMSDLDKQTPTISEALPAESPADIYTRPLKPGKIPKLQGPFQFELSADESDNELDVLLTDIYVIGAKINAEELMLGEDEDLELSDIEQEGLSMNVICLLSTSGRVTVCLDMEDVQAQWLPQTKSKLRRWEEDTEPPSLLVYEALDTLTSKEQSEHNWPVFSEDAVSRYSCFVTNSSSITFISLSPWVFKLETELREDSDPGVEFRLDLLAKGQSSIRERVFARGGTDNSRLAPLAASAVLRDPDLGYFLLSSTSQGPISLTFEQPDLELSPPSPTAEDDNTKPLLLIDPRPAYEPPAELQKDSALPSLLEKLHHSKYKRLMSEEVRLSPATLSVLTDAHKILSEETHRMGKAASELFRRCQRLQLEMREQIERANHVANLIEEVTGEAENDDEPKIAGNEGIEKRLDAAKEKQQQLMDRLEKLRKKAAKSTNRELTEKEKAWINEVSTIEHAVFPENETESATPTTRRRAMEPWKRYDEIKNLLDELVPQAKEAAEKTAEEEESEHSAIRVPSEIRNAKVKQVMGLLEREQALVDATQRRLETLNMS